MSEAGPGVQGQAGAGSEKQKLIIHNGKLLTKRKRNKVFNKEIRVPEEKKKDQIRYNK